jgi:hypothetical protein
MPESQSADEARRLGAAASRRSQSTTVCCNIARELAKQPNRSHDDPMNARVARFDALTSAPGAWARARLIADAGAAR